MRRERAVARRGVLRALCECPHGGRRGQREWYVRVAVLCKMDGADGLAAVLLVLGKCWGVLVATEAVGRGARALTTVAAATEGAAGVVARVPAPLHSAGSVKVPPPMVVATVVVAVAAVVAAGGLNGRVETHIHCTYMR